MTAISLETLQIEGGSTATEYEPPTPTPDYPIEIHSLNDFDVVSQKSEGGMIDGVEVGGRNLLTNSNYFRNKWKGIVNVNYIEYENRNERYTYIYVRRLDNNSLREAYMELDRTHVQDGEYVTLSFDISNLITSPLIFELEGVIDKNGNKVRKRIEGGNSDRLILTGIISDTVDSDSFGIKLSSPVLSTNFNFLMRYIKLEKGNKATDWTPAPEDITENDNHPLIDKINLLLSEPLRSVGDVKDRLFRDSDGLWKIERNVEEYIPNGSESWTYLYTQSDSSKDVYEISNLNPRSMNYRVSYPMSNMFSTSSSPPPLLGQLKASSIYLSFGFPKDYIEDTSSMTANQISVNAKDFFRNNSVVCQYALETPTIETLDEELQDKLNNLRSFQDSNYVYILLRNEEGGYY